jgi:hypothetical protein
MMQNETQFGDWEWFKGNVPSGLVQPWYRDKNQAQAEMAETYDTSMLDWHFHKTSGAHIIAFRRVIEPVRGDVVLTGADFGDGFLFAVGGRYGVDTHRLTLPTIDGKLTPGKYTGPDGAVVTVEVLGKAGV